MMTRKDWLESGLSLLGGASIGAALMYLLDPEHGEERRQRVRESAAEGLYGAGERIGSTFRSLSDRARDWGGDLSDRAADYIPAFTSRNARRSGRHMFEQARQYASRAGSVFRRGRGREFPVLSLALTTCGALALGAGLMFIFDPQQGRRRRALARDKMVRAAHETGDAVRRTRQYVGDQARGLAASARSRLSFDEPTDEQLRARVRSAIGRAVTHPSSIEVEAHGGYIVLSGPVLASEVNSLLSAARSVRGVNDVENRLETHETSANVPGLQGEGRTGENI